MKEQFMSKSELVELLPWSRNVVTNMIRAGVFRPLANPVGRKHSKQFFWRPQVEKALERMIGEERKERHA